MFLGVSFVLFCFSLPCRQMSYAPFQDLLPWGWWHPNQNLSLNHLFCWKLSCLWGLPSGPVKKEKTIFRNKYLFLYFFTSERANYSCQNGIINYSFYVNNLPCGWLFVFKYFYLFFTNEIKLSFSLHRQFFNLSISGNRLYYSFQFIYWTR